MEMGIGAGHQSLSLFTGTAWEYQTYIHGPSEACVYVFSHPNCHQYYQYHTIYNPISDQITIALHIISYHPKIVPYHTVSYNIIPIPCHPMSYHIIPYIIPYHTIYHTISYHISYHISYIPLSYHISYHIIPYHTISYHVIPYHTMSYHVIPYIIPYHTIHISSHFSSHISNTIFISNKNTNNDWTYLFLLHRYQGTASPYDDFATA
jgi:hypothetical protein